MAPCERVLPESLSKPLPLPPCAVRAYMAAEGFHAEIRRGAQRYAERTRDPEGPLGRPLLFSSSFSHRVACSPFLGPVIMGVTCSLVQ